MTSPTKQESFSQGFDTVRQLMLHPQFSDKLSAAIRKEGGADKAVEAMLKAFGLNIPQTLEEMIARCFAPECVSHFIHESVFSLEREGAYDPSSLCFFCDEDRSMDNAQAEGIIKGIGGKSEGLVRGLALCYELHRKGELAHVLNAGPIVFSASSFVTDGRIYTPFADNRRGVPSLLCATSLNNREERRWPMGTRFLMSSKSRS
jgi:hypothetical protein